jgi:hypothetical protein
MVLCLAGGAVLVRIAAAAFTLSWTHTVERIPWQEDWRVEDDRLVLQTVRLKGSGAGMEPAPEARLVDGWYVWHPVADARGEIVLRRADGAIAGDWSICTEAEGCRALADLVGTADPVRIHPCR